MPRVSYDTNLVLLVVASYPLNGVYSSELFANLGLQSIIKLIYQGTGQAW